MPNGLGKESRVAVFTSDTMAEKALAAGADIIGNKELLEKVCNNLMYWIKGGILIRKI
jgi:large subunit ribosomal protein L1